jgi:hypothetical protein
MSLQKNQTKCSPTTSCIKINAHNFILEESSPKVYVLLKFSKKTSQSEESSLRRNFAQSGHPELK